jgi:hypothetical protein
MKNPASSRPDSSASAVVDHGILDLGTSVKVNDDLRRSLETEMQLIDENTTKLKKQITNEHAISNELSKTKSRANKEVAGLRQGAIEGVESITMNERVFGGLQKTFRTELRDSTNSQDAMMDGATNDKENKQQENLPPSIPFIKKTQKNNDIEASRIYGGIENQSKIVHAFVNKKKEIREDVKSVLAVMETDQLESRLTKEKQNTKAAEETIGVELKRSATIKSNLATLKARNAEMKKQIEEMVRCYTLFAVYLPAGCFVTNVTRTFFRLRINWKNRKRLQTKKPNWTRKMPLPRKSFVVKRRTWLISRRNCPNRRPRWKPSRDATSKWKPSSPLAKRRKKNSPSFVPNATLSFLKRPNLKPT